MSRIREFISGFLAYVKFRRGLRVAEGMFDDSLNDFEEHNRTIDDGGDA